MYKREIKRVQFSRRRSNLSRDTQTISLWETIIITQERAKKKKNNATRIHV